MKIKKLSIKSFRGIPALSSLDFTDDNGKPLSVIIYGENGSGKSSIVDALEFCIQGRIEHSTTIINPNRPTIINQFIDNCTESYVSVLFDKEKTPFKRELKQIEHDYTGETYYSANITKPHCDFSIAPIVLRRSDITAFNTTPEDSKLILLKRFLYDLPVDSLLSNDPYILMLRKYSNGLLDLLEDIKKSLAAECEFDDNVFEIQNVNLEHIIRSKYYPRGNKPDDYSVNKQQCVGLSNFNNMLNLAIEYNTIRSKFISLTEEINDLLSVNVRKFKPLEKYYSKLGEFITIGFKSITNAKYVDSIRLVPSDGCVSSLRIDIALQNNRVVSSNEIFSEANNDLIVLLLYVGLIKLSTEYLEEKVTLGIEEKSKNIKKQNLSIYNCNGNTISLLPEEKRQLANINKSRKSRLNRQKLQSKILILDDVLQSVDSNVRSKFVQYILTIMSDWQFFFTCHDRLWCNQLKLHFQQNRVTYKEFHIKNWSFENGPIIIEESFEKNNQLLAQAIDTGVPRIIAPVSGVFLEMICQKLSVSLHCNVKRVEGDRYTLADLWEPVKSKLSNFDEFAEILNELDQSLFIRNMYGCHYNEWADQMPDQSIYQFASFIQQLYELSFCSKCCRWITDNNNRTSCRCGLLSYK